MAPKIEWPAASSISMRTRSPNFRNGVFGLPVQDRLDGAQLGEAGVADAALLHRLAGPAVRLVGDGAGADDGAGAEPPRLGGVRDQLRETRRSCPGPALGLPSSLPLIEASSGRCSLPSCQALAQLVRRHRHRRERRRRLAVEEAEALGELGRDQIAQRDVVDQHHAAGCARAASAAVAPIGTSSVTTATSPSRSMPQASSASAMGSRGAEKGVRAALVHQRIGPEARRHLGAARLAHQLDMVHVGRAVGPLIGARQRRRAAAFRSKSTIGKGAGRLPSTTSFNSA